ncbi:Clathrin interactor 1 [Liparis tanakae]|uniref:Clathrin interactor 1 n=1 Tax=Liparis tanakae TaxID=230148 RepID=A0A4Z2E7H3_9TELE|nr:Clathrin interactor 1 [Liparis tanakae]
MPAIPLSRSQQSLGGMTPQQPIGQQQKVGGGGPGSLGSTWSDPSVNISLDFLSAGLNPTKTPPTLNNIIHQQGVPPVNLLAQSFGGLNLSSPPHAPPSRPPATPLMASNAMTKGMPASMGTGMPVSLASSLPPSMTTGMGGIAVNQGVMGMNISMNMGMATPVMMGGMAGMGVPGVRLGLAHSITPAAVPPKQDAFANFGSFGK